MDANIVQVYAFRHGETDWNAAGRFQGHTDIPLNDNGRRQAESLSKFFAVHNIEHIFSSDLIRAQQTAQIAARPFNLNIELHPGLRETNLGSCEGLHEAQVVELVGRDHILQWASILPEHSDVRFPLGESKREHLQRMKETLETLLLGCPYRSVGVSTHGGSLRRLVHDFAPHLTEAVKIPNCGVYHFEFARATKQWRVVADHPLAL